jgi:hypothetical protein
MRITHYLLVLLLALSFPAPSAAETPRMKILFNGKVSGSYLLVGENVEGVQALDVEFDYDATVLFNPKLLITGGEMSQVRADVPGKVFISIYRPVPDYLLKLTVTFDKLANVASGGIYHVSVVVKSTDDGTATTDPGTTPDSAGSGMTEGTTPAPVTAGVDRNIPAEPVQQANRTALLEKNTGTVSPAAPDGVILVASLPKVNREDAPVKAAGADVPSIAATGEEPPADIGREVHGMKLSALLREEKSVLQRFRKFDGDKALSSFTALFRKSKSERITQEPAIAISDGKTPVTIRVEWKSEASLPIGIALSDARLLLKEVGDKYFVISVLPSAGTWDATLAVATGGEVVDYPIVVAPPVDLDGGINEDNFIGALHEYIVKQPPALHLEKRTYLSEYIFTANYLSSVSRKGSN